MQAPTLFQLTLSTPKAESGPIAGLLENSEPTPLSVSHYETTDHIWNVAAIYDHRPDSQAIRTLIAETLALAPDALEVQLEQIPEKNWVAHVQSELKPVAAGRFLIHGEHDRDKARPHPFAIEINAAEAFGTAHHGTTKGCLIAMDQLSDQFEPASILDIGTGTGILAIAGHKIWPSASITASDIDPKAISIAAANATYNQATKINFIKASGLDHAAITTSSPYDLIIANILAKPLISMASDIIKALAANGQLILSGILEGQADEVTIAYQKKGLNNLQTNHFDEWVTIEFSKTKQPE